MIFGAPGPAVDDDIVLPPLDGGSDDDPAGETDSDDLDPVPADAGKDAFDDATGTDDPVDLDEIDPLDGESLVTRGDADPLDDLEEDAEFLEDRGSDPALESESMLADNDVPGVGDEDFGIGEDEPVAANDGGEEGPRDADDELREEDLPALDADDLGDGDDGDFFEMEIAVAPPFAWDEPRWNARVIASIGAVVDVFAMRGGAVAIGVDPPQLWKIDSDHVELKMGEGAPREGWRAVRGDRKTGEILLETDAGTFVSIDGGGRFVHRAGAATSALVAPSLTEIQRELAGRGLALDGLKVTAAAIVDEAGTLLTALRRAGDETGGTWLVRVPIGGSVCRTVGLLRGFVWSLSWDEGGARIWVASDDGVTIFEQPLASISQ